MQENVTERVGFLFEGTMDEVDPATARITAFEEARQVDKLVMIASESAAPAAVRAALATVFTDLYAEGYPAARSLREPEELLADVPHQVAHHERFGDRRYYKGTEFADLVEVLAQERIRDLFAPNRFPANGSQIGPDQIQANVQPLSGANANTAVYMGLLQAGDTIMGMNLAQGGHLSHGSPVNISGKLFRVVAYGVNPATGRIDYDEVERLAREHNPRMIVSGASAYPWGIDFVRLRRICDGLPRKAYLLADVSHPAGLVVAGLFPNPVGVADVTTFTTHKTLIGPRAAVILTTNELLARRIDRAVFPGLQGGPHINTIAALAVAFKIAQGDDFAELQRTIVKNAQALAETLQRRGLTLAYGGTETHLLLVDLREINQPSGVSLNGDVAARILDLVGIVCNKNTIIGDLSATHPSGIRLGTPWITQRGLTPDDMRVLGGVIADVLLGIVTFPYFDADESAARGKIPADLLKRSQATIANLITRRAVGPRKPDGWPDTDLPRPLVLAGRQLFDIAGRRAIPFLTESTSGDVESVRPGEATWVDVLDADARRVATIGLLRRQIDEFGRDHVVMAVDREESESLIWWFRALSSGLVLFDQTDPWAKVDGPVAVAPLGSPLTPEESVALGNAIDRAQASPNRSKPYFVGQRALLADKATTHQRPLARPGDRDSDARWTLAQSYGDSAVELVAVRERVGAIDQAGLGIVEISGPDAQRFLDLVTTNDVLFLAQNAAQYTFFLDSRGQVVADGLIYRIAPERFLVTTQPSRAVQLIGWLTDLSSGQYAIDPEVSERALPNRVTIRDVSIADQPDARSVIGIAGQSAPALLRTLSDTPEDQRKIGRVRRFTSLTIRLAGVPILLARTSHTGVAQGFEIFAPADKARALWDAVLARGADHGVSPVGFDAWRAAGVAAGLPWMGHELAGPDAISPIQAGYGAVVRPHKPFFVGRSALLAQPHPPTRVIVRFKVSEETVNPVAVGDLLRSSDGACVGRVTSMSLVASEPIGLAFAEHSTCEVGAKFDVVMGQVEELATPFGYDIGGGRASRKATIEVLPRFTK